MTKENRYYLDDIMAGHFFDVQDLSDLWKEESDGWGSRWYTTDKEEAVWFESLAEAYVTIDERGDQEEVGNCNDYDDIIGYAESLKCAA